MKFKYEIRIQSLTKAECKNMALYVRWKRGNSSRKQGRTTVEWEENGSVVWDNEKLTMIATLYRDTKRGTYASKMLSLTVEKHTATKKGEVMGSVWLDLSQFASEDEPLASKALKRNLIDGPFSGALLRATLSCRLVDQGNTDESDDATSEAAPDEEVESAEEDAKYFPAHRRRKDDQKPKQSAPALYASTTPAPSSNRAAAPPMEICSVCGEAPAIIACDDCKRACCGPCDGGLHMSDAMARHGRRSLPGATKPGRIRSKGMQAKVREVMRRAGLTDIEAHAFLTRCDCDVDGAVVPHPHLPVWSRGWSRGPEKYPPMAVVCVCVCVCARARVCLRAGARVPE